MENNMHKITLIPGDGIGPEIVEQTIKLFDFVGVEIEWDIQIAGIKAIEKHGEPLPKSVIESIKSNKVALNGPITTPI
jgi:isocitrate dehydrogenase (NAD+)